MARAPGRHARRRRLGHDRDGEVEDAVRHGGHLDKVPDAAVAEVAPVGRGGLDERAVHEPARDLVRLPEPRARDAQPHHIVPRLRDGHVEEAHECALEQLFPQLDGGSKPPARHPFRGRSHDRCEEERRGGRELGRRREAVEDRHRVVEAASARPNETHYSQSTAASSMFTSSGAGRSSSASAGLRMSRSVPRCAGSVAGVAAWAVLGGEGGEGTTLSAGALALLLGPSWRCSSAFCALTASISVLRLCRRASTLCCHRKSSVRIAALARGRTTHSTPSSRHRVHGWSGAPLHCHQRSNAAGTTLSFCRRQWRHALVRFGLGAGELESRGMVAGRSRLTGARANGRALSLAVPGKPLPHPGPRHWSHSALCGERTRVSHTC